MVSTEFAYKLKALYWANEGGFSLSSPIKMYHGFIINKIHETHSSKLKKLAWQITHIATGLLVYPTLGFLACLDMGGKLLSWHLNGKKHNTQIANLKLLFANIHDEPAAGFSLSFKSRSNGLLKTPTLKIFREYYIQFGAETIDREFNANKKELKSKIKAFVKKFSDNYTKVYMTYKGSWRDGITINFLAADSVLPYCSNPSLPKYKKVTYPVN